MAWRSHGTTNAGLVEALVKHAVIRSPLVRDAMAAVDRGHFVRAGTDAYGIPRDAREAASALAAPNDSALTPPFHRRYDLSYYDSPAPIGFSATISAPHMHAHCLELLQDKLTPGARVLVAARRSYIDAWFPLVADKLALGVTAAPVCWRRARSASSFT